MLARFNPFRWGDRKTDRKTPANEDRVAAPAEFAWTLEPRFVFDAAGAASGAELAEQQAAEDAIADGGADAAFEDASSDSDLAAVFENYLPRSQNNEIVFIDGGVENYDELLAGIDPQAEVVVIHPDDNGLQEMADFLAGRNGVKAVHILCHGGEGSLELGNLSLSTENLKEFASLLGEIGESLSADGDILFYGCSLGDGAFVAALREMTGAKISPPNTDGQLV